MRTAILSVAFIAASGVSFAQPGGGYSSTEGKYTVKFPGEPRVTTKTAKTAVGELKVVTAVFATSDGNVYLVSYTDFPAVATKPENRGTLYEGVRDGLKGRDGKVVSDKEIEFGLDKLPGRELIVDKDKGKQRMKFRVFLRDNRLYQVAVIGTADFVAGKDAAGFLKSMELTK